VNDVDDSSRNFRATLEPTNTIDGTRVRSRNDTSGNIIFEERWGGGLPPITDFDDLVKLWINSSCHSNIFGEMAYRVDIASVV
jgi:hypothetical protein